MPSNVVHRLLGEADVPKPGALHQQAFPRTGSQGTVRWRMVRLLGVAPTNIEPDLYEDWLEQLYELRVREEEDLGEVPVDQLPRLAQTEADPQIAAFIREVEQMARHQGADRVAFTTLEGLAG